MLFPDQMIDLPIIKICSAFLISAAILFSPAVRYNEEESLDFNCPAYELPVAMTK